MLVFLAFLLVFFIVSHIVLVLFLLTMHRTLKLIRPQYRSMPPGCVWLCLIPYLRVFPAIWMVHATSASLRRQFEALGQSEQGDAYASVSGIVWVYGFGVSLVIELLGYAFDSSELMGVTLLPLMVSFIAWIVYWAQIAVYKGRLKRHLTASYSDDELDYGDDIGRRDPEEDDSYRPRR